MDKYKKIDINTKEWKNYLEGKFKNSIRRSIIITIFKSTAEERITDYLTQVGYKIISTDPDLVAIRAYNRSVNQTCPPYNNSIVFFRFTRENGQTKVDINYRISSMLPWEKAFYFTEIKDLKTALNNDSPVKRTTSKILWIGFLITIAISIVGFGGLGLLGCLLIFGIVKVLSNVTDYPDFHWMNISIAIFIIAHYPYIFLMRKRREECLRRSNEQGFFTIYTN